MVGFEQMHSRVVRGGSTVKTLVVAEEEGWLQLQAVAMWIELPLEQGELETMVGWAGLSEPMVGLLED